MKLRRLMARAMWGLPFILSLLYPSLLPGERPYFVTYDHEMEEPGDLEFAIDPTIGITKSANGFVGTTVEIEYGLKAWWTTEFYLDSQSTRRDGTLFTGWRWENRFRPLMREHWINPVLYVEYEDINGADKSLKEIVGHDSEEDLATPNRDARLERKREVETKLILSSNFKGWNVSENFIAEKNLAHEPWEFGYTFGFNRPLGLEASSVACNFCRENFFAGLEVFGGLGDWNSFGLKDTSHYLGPLLSWQLRNGTTIRFSPAFGLTGQSTHALLRFSVSYELQGFGRHLKRRSQ